MCYSRCLFRIKDHRVVFVDNNNNNNNNNYNKDFYVFSTCFFITFVGRQ